MKQSKIQQKTESLNIIHILTFLHISNINIQIFTTMFTHFEQKLQAQMKMTSKKIGKNKKWVSNNKSDNMNEQSWKTHSEQINLKHQNLFETFIDEIFTYLKETFTMHFSEAKKKWKWTKYTDKIKRSQRDWNEKMNFQKKMQELNW